MQLELGLKYRRKSAKNCASKRSPKRRQRTAGDAGMLAAKLYIKQAPGSHIPKTKSPKHPKVHAASKRPFPLLMPLRIPASPIKIGMQASSVTSWAVWAKNLKKTVSNKASHPSYNVIFASLCGQASRRISATTSKTPPSCKLRNLTAERSSTNAMDGRAIKQATSQGMPVERKAPFRVLRGSHAVLVPQLGWLDERNDGIQQWMCNLLVPWCQLYQWCDS